MRGMPEVGLLVQLAAGQRDLFGVDDHYEIACIEVRGENHTMLAAQEAGNFTGEPSERLAIGVDQQPFVLDITELRNIRPQHQLLTNLKQ